jgi:PKD repeat protein
VKTKKNDINLRKLFRQKLENAEVIPDAAVKSKLMRKVARKEFMRFNPARLNIYYIAGLLISGIAIAVLILSGSENSYNLNSVKQSASSGKTDTDNYFQLRVNQPARQEAEKAIENLDKVKVSNSVTHRKNEKTTEASKVSRPVQNNTFLPVSINKSLSKNGLYPEGASAKKKLQSINKPDLFMIEPNTSEGCAPFKIRFHNNAAAYDSCRWTFGDGGYSNEKDPEWIFDVEGEYKIVLQVFNQNGQNLSSFATVKVHPKPQAHFEITPEKAVLPNDEIHFLNYSVNAVGFRWKFGDGSTSESFEPSHTYAKFNNYDVSLVAYSDWGCSDSLIVSNAFLGSEYFIDFPNAFIPNEQGPTGGYFTTKSDEAAQIFHPSYSGVTEYQLKIFSKLGIPIFESVDINLGWDGYNKGQLCEPGVYIWKVRGKFRNGEPFIKMGDVTLLKN